MSRLAITTYIWCTCTAHTIYHRDFIKHAVIYSANVQFLLTLRTKALPARTRQAATALSLLEVTHIVQMSRLVGRLKVNALILVSQDHT
jgi:hypothetical protein